MSKIILDFGSGNTCSNNRNYIKKMYDELKKIDKNKHEIIIKWQLFMKVGLNIPLTHESFDYAYRYGTKLGYNVTSSIFDKESLDFLLQYDIPFIKIANNRNLDWLIGEIPRKMPVYASCKINDKINYKYDITQMFCISKYPAVMKDYEELNCFPSILCEYRNFAVSDHTTNFDLFNKYYPDIIEWHYALENDENNLDGGLFARTPKQLLEVL